MKNYYDTFKTFVNDRINQYFIVALLVFFLADFFIWSKNLRYQDIYIFSINGVYPIRFLAIIILVNTLLAFFSYEKEKEISYLLLGANIFIAILVFILELFYLINLNYG